MEAMPIIYLSPSTQEFNPYVNGGNEELYMNLVADAMEPYLYATGIRFTRNTPDMNAAQSIAASNAGNYDLHLALHSNAAAGENSGKIRGTDVYYYPQSSRGQRAATIIANNLKEIYPLPNLVKTVPTTTLGEVAKTRAPGVLIEFAYHDNVEDANWIKANIEPIAKNVVMSLADYFGISFREPQSPNETQPTRTGTVRITSGYLNIRNAPSSSGTPIARAYNGETVTILGESGNFYKVIYNGKTGYASKTYIAV